MLDQATKKRVVDKVNECIVIVEKKYNVIFRKPLVTFNVRGTVGGRAHYGEWKVDFNPILLAENTEKFLTSTVPHEVAHLATKLVYPHALVRRPGKKRSPHGAEWASIMVALGAAPNRCHTYDVENAQVRRVNRASYDYVCECGHAFSLGPKRHAKLQRSPTAYKHTGCRLGGRLSLAAPKAQPVITPVAAPAAPEVPTGETKLARCYRLFENYPGYTRAEMINVFIQEADMSAAGAATYYAKCKALRG